MFDREPSLEAATLTKLLIDRDGPTVTISMQIRDYPSDPPARWRMHQHNAVMIEVQAMGVEDVSIAGWSTDNKVSILVERLPGRIRIQASGEGTDIEIRCGWLRIAGVTPYCRVA